MKRWDYVIVAGALMLFAVCFIWLRIGVSAADTGVGFKNADIGEADGGLSAEVRVAGELYDTISLERGSTTDVAVPMGRLTVKSEGGEVYVSYADCPSQDCVRTARIGNTGEIIACLPNRVLISVVTKTGPNVLDDARIHTNREAEVDAIAR